MLRERPGYRVSHTNAAPRQRRAPTGPRTGSATPSRFHPGVQSAPVSAASGRFCPHVGPASCSSTHPGGTHPRTHNPQARSDPRAAADTLSPKDNSARTCNPRGTRSSRFHPAGQCAPDSAVSAGSVRPAAAAGSRARHPGGSLPPSHIGPEHPGCRAPHSTPLPRQSPAPSAAPAGSPRSSRSDPDDRSAPASAARCTGPASPSAASSATTPAAGPPPLHTASARPDRRWCGNIPPPAGTSAPMRTSASPPAARTAAGTRAPHQ